MDSFEPKRGTAERARSPDLPEGVRCPDISLLMRGLKARQDLLLQVLTARTGIEAQNQEVQALVGHRVAAASELEILASGPRHGKAAHGHADLVGLLAVQQDGPFEAAEVCPIGALARLAQD